jgi:hypothetical protein
MPDSFTYTTYEIAEDKKTVYFHYRVFHAGEVYELTETIVFPVELIAASTHNALRALHLALGVSYYKIYVPGVIIHPYAMDNNEANFWNTLWQHGLGEFLYVNKLPSDRLAQFSAHEGTPLESNNEGDVHGRSAVLGIGGGKDSAVAGELLKELGVPVTGFVMATGEQLGQTKAVADVMGVDLLVVQRQIDQKLLELQEMPGAYKGHVPISAIFGLVGCVVAMNTGNSYVVVANESSASTPRIQWNDSDVNHQWSKSFTFEQMLQDFIRDYISLQTRYFSVIRQLSSVGVAKIFATYPQYFEVFTSDNFVFRIDPANRPNGRWSLESPKSLSSFILLAPWLEEKELERIFGINFLDQESLEPLFWSLIGVEGNPPLDCVGTVEELSLSLRLLHVQEKFRKSHLMKQADKRKFFDTPVDEELLKQLLSLGKDQVLPDLLVNLVTDTLQAKVDA